jgi:hypothetical protein
VLPVKYKMNVYILSEEMNSLNQFDTFFDSFPPSFVPSLKEEVPATGIVCTTRRMCVTLSVLLVTLSQPPTDCRCIRKI